SCSGQSSCSPSRCAGRSTSHLEQRRKGEAHACDDGGPRPCTCGRTRIVGDLEDRNAALEQRAGSRHMKSEYRRAKDENKVVGAEFLGQPLRRSRQEARKQRVILGKTSAARERSLLP